MADFTVDYALLESIENTLSSLKRQFDNVGSEPQAADWGHGRIAQAMDSFAGNWDHHRDKLQASIEAMARQARETRTQTDHWDSTMQHQVAPQ